MVSGLPLSDNEKAYIRANKDKSSFRDIAIQLGILYPLDNGGSRNRQSVRNEARREEHRPYTGRRRNNKGRFMKLLQKE